MCSFLQLVLVLCCITLTHTQPMSIGGGAAQLSNVIVEYTTDGEVRLNVMNITFVTTELHVVLLGCDVGYYDNYLLSPPKPSWKTQVTPFQCIECECQAFESIREEVFIVV